MTKLPERIKIISKRYTIEWCEHGKTELPEESDGECHFETQRILIKAGMPTDLQRETLLHEVLHAIEGEMDLVNLTEEHVQGISKGMLAVLMDNPSFARYLLKKA